MQRYGFALYVLSCYRSILNYFHVSYVSCANVMPPSASDQAPRNLLPKTFLIIRLIINNNTRVSHNEALTRSMRIPVMKDVDRVSKLLILPKLCSQNVLNYFFFEPDNCSADVYSCCTSVCNKNVICIIPK